MKNILSVIIITKNEASHISRCLQSISWADEIIVLDSGSTDNTVELCKKFTDSVFETDWPGFGPQKQRALDKAQYDWVLSIDADEWVTAELKEEILSVVKSTDTQGYNIPRLSQYCGREMKHGGWWPDYVLRLFLKQNGKFSESLVHERVILDGKQGKLKEPLLHESYTTLDEVLSKTNNYSSLGAQMLYEKKTKSSITKAIMRGMWTFFRTYIVKTSFLDGEQGLMLAISNAETTYYKYAKLHLLNKQKKEACHRSA